jgi:hypothetical protein
MRRYRNTLTEADITYDDQPGFEIFLKLEELGCSPGEVPPEHVSLTTPSGDTVDLERLGEAIDKAGNHLYWSYYNDWPDDPIHLVVGT